MKNKKTEIEDLNLDMMKARFKEDQKFGFRPRISARTGLRLVELASRSIQTTAALQTAIDRLEDMLKGDDGQAWKEAKKALPGLRTALKGNNNNED
jgi:hypothetical protein